jgi:hypothetical protein
MTKTIGACAETVQERDTRRTSSATKTSQRTRFSSHHKRNHTGFFMVYLASEWKMMTTPVRLEMLSCVAFPTAARMRRCGRASEPSKRGVRALTKRGKRHAQTRKKAAPLHYLPMVRSPLEKLQTTLVSTIKVCLESSCRFKPQARSRIAKDNTFPC